MVEILYYTDSSIKPALTEKVRKQILKSNLPITSVSLKPIDFGNNIVLNRSRGHLTMFKQILMGLVASDAKYLFMIEHDVLYHPSHFEFVPPRDDIYYYNNNVWKYRLKDHKVVGYDCKWLSQCCANRQILIEHYVNKLKAIADGKRAYGFEPGAGQSKYLTPYGAENWESEYPNIDIRHGHNFSGVARMDPSEFRNKKSCQNWKEISPEQIPGWEKGDLP